MIASYRGMAGDDASPMSSYKSGTLGKVFRMCIDHRYTLCLFLKNRIEEINRKQNSENVVAHGRFSMLQKSWHFSLECCNVFDNSSSNHIKIFDILLQAVYIG